MAPEYPNDFWQSGACSRGGILGLRVAKNLAIRLVTSKRQSWHLNRQNMTSLFAKSTPIAIDTLGSRIRRVLWRLSMLGLPRGPHITRFSMYAHLAKIGLHLPRRSGKILSVSHSANLADVMGLQATEIVQADYPEYSMLSLPFPDESFDFVLSDQVLEHVEGNPERAVQECHRILKSGGVSVLTTCLINPVHGAPRDFWRFTPDALRWLHRDWSEIIDCGGWGNFEAWSVIRDGLRLDGIPLASWHPLHRQAARNDPRWPIVVWIAARK